MRRLQLFMSEFHFPQANISQGNGFGLEYIIYGSN